MTREPVKFDKGSIGEASDWSIEFDWKVRRGAETCGHCVNRVCPRVVRARSLDEWDYTVICLDCVLEAAKGLS